MSSARQGAAPAESREAVLRTAEEHAAQQSGLRRLQTRLSEWVAAERQHLVFLALVLAANKALVLFASIYAHRRELDTLGLRGFVEWVLVDNYRFFDASWYQRIATEGYELKSTAFFPLYPLAMKAVQAVTGLRFLTAGVLFSHACFVLLLYAFLRLALVDLDERRARWAVLFLALFPTSYYFSAAYTEALFVLLSVLALYGMRTRRWWMAGVFGGLAALTRNTGILLVIPFALEYGACLLRLRKERGSLAARDLLPAGWGLAIASGGLVYVAFLWLRFGDPFAFANVQELYGRGSLPPWETLVRGYRFGLEMLTRLRDPRVWIQIYYPLQLFFVSLVLIVLVGTFRRLPWSYWVIILYSFLIPLAAPAAPDRVTDYFISFSRYSLVIVPLYFGLEVLLARRYLKLAYLTISVALLLLLTWAWSHHYWVA
jgi:hypothetical protein